MLRTVTIAAALTAAFASANSASALSRDEPLNVPALKNYAAPAELSNKPPFDIIGVFRMTIAPDGSTRDVDLLVVKPADSVTRADVPAAVARDVRKAGGDALRSWRYEESTADSNVRVTFRWFTRTSGSPNAPSGRLTAVEACLPDGQLAKPTVIPFFAVVGPGSQLHDVSIAGGPRYLHKAAKTILDQWRFSETPEQTRLQSVLRFFPADCHVTGW